MKRIILFLLTCLSVSANAQTNTKKDFEPPLVLRGIGVSFQKFDGLNSRIANLPQYKKLRDHAGTLDLGFMKVHNRFISEIDFTAGSSMSGDRDKKSSTIRYLGAGIDIGYDVIRSEKILLYPLVGLGGLRYQARFYKDNSAIPFDIVLASSDAQNNIRPVDFLNSFFTYRLGLGFALRAPKDPSCILGIQAGYTGSFKDRSWKSSDNQELAGAPVDGISQFHVSLIMTGMPKMGKHMK
ncbi:MAG: hypothetical protein ABI402_00090 [Ferruginibacter sp.]